jgi:protein-S-isoprenylcysteine O-methyltransferase Ste14
MTEISPEDVQEVVPEETVDQEIVPEEGVDQEAKTIAAEPAQEEESRSPFTNFREASYVVLFIAAVFIINAMETGSYRTPWPVAIVTLLVGLGLFGYSWHLKSRSGT